MTYPLDKCFNWVYNDYMTMKKEKIIKNSNIKGEARQYFIQEIERLMDQLFIPAINVKTEYNSEQDCEYAHRNEYVVFAIRPQLRYRRCTIIYTDAAIDMYKEKRFEEIKETLVHELCHLHTEHITRLSMERYATKREITDANEELTETLAIYARELIKLRNKKLC